MFTRVLAMICDSADRTKLNGFFCAIGLDTLPGNWMAIPSSSASNTVVKWGCSTVIKPALADLISDATGGLLPGGIVWGDYGLSAEEIPSLLTRTMTSIADRADAGDVGTANYLALKAQIPVFAETDYMVAWGDSLTASGYPQILQISFGSQRPCYNFGVGGETAAQVRARQVADQLYNRYINLLWVGRNGFKVTTPASIIADIDLMIAHVVGGRWLVGSVPPSTLDSGAENTLRLALNAAFEAEYGDRYVDIVAAWQAANDGSADDLSDIAAGYTPRSLRGDELHPNDDGDAVIAAAWKTAILAKGW